MIKKIIRNFIKDMLVFSSGYFASTLIIIFYFYVSGISKGLLYPFYLSLFIYFITMAIAWIRYYKFNLNILKVAERKYYDLQPITVEQNEVAEAISKIHDNFIQEIGKMNMESMDFKHFLSQWIHNMKTPVSIINLIVEKGIDESQGDTCLFKDIQEENSKLLSGLEQVLNIIRMDEFFIDYEPQPVKIATLVKEVINTRKSQFIYNNVYPKLEIQDENLEVLTDPKWNKFMVEQILSNAIKYSAVKGEKKNVYFSVKKEENQVILEIRDEGIGIPKYDIKRVFDPFFTGDNGRKFGNSTGIGLYVSKAVADRLGHKIWIESEIDKGTKVFIDYLPKV